MCVKKIGLFALIVFTGMLFLAFNINTGKKITGHWIAEIDLCDMKVNDTLIFTKVKYTEELYHWGGAIAGIELGEENSFSEFHNVMCSTESSPVWYHDEKWSLHNDLFTIKGSEREAAWRILNVTNKKMKIVVLKIDKHEH